MTGLERTVAFIKGEDVDQLPFHPILMRWAAKYAGIKYRDFCLDPMSKCRAMILCARDFDFDWVTVLSDPWTEASAFGIHVEYPEDNMPIDTGGHMPDAISVSLLRNYDPLKSQRCLNRLQEIKEFKKHDIFISPDDSIGIRVVDQKDGLVIYEKYNKFCFNNAFVVLNLF